jgi:hypothetical protein
VIHDAEGFDYEAAKKAADDEGLDIVHIPLSVVKRQDQAGIIEINHVARHADDDIRQDKYEAGSPARQQENNDGAHDKIRRHPAVYPAVRHEYERETDVAYRYNGDQRGLPVEAKAVADIQNSHYRNAHHEHREQRYDVGTLYKPCRGSRKDGYYAKRANHIEDARPKWELVRKDIFIIDID